MTEAKKLEPRKFRFISRHEAATMLGCSYQTVCNWIESGILKGRKIERAEMVDIDTIEALFDTAADVARTEELLKERKKELKAEIKSFDDAIIDLRNENKQNIQDRALRSLIDNSVLLAKDTLHDYEADVVSGLLQGKSSIEIAKELDLTRERVRQISLKAIPKFLSHLDYSEVREENNELRKKADELQKEVDSLKQTNSVLGIARKIEGTPLSLELKKYGFSVRTLNKLDSIGCKNLADIIKMDSITLLNKKNFGKATIKAIENKLESMGLRLGMNLDSMSDEDFSDIVSRLTELTGYKPRTPDSKFKSLNIEHEKTVSLKKLKSVEGHLKNNIDELEKKLAKKNDLLESSKKNLREAYEIISSQKESIYQQKLEIKSLKKEIDNAVKENNKLKKNTGHKEITIVSSEDKLRRKEAIFEHKESTMKTWIKGLEEDLASKREYIKSLEAAQKELREENEKLKAQVADSDV